MDRAPSKRDGRRGTVAVDSDCMGTLHQLEEETTEQKAQAARWNSSVDIAEVFQKFDMDGNGEIDLEELIEILQLLDPVLWTRENVKKLWGVVDSNDDGVLSYDEFADWLTKPKRPKKFEKDHIYDAEDLLHLTLNFEALPAPKEGSLPVVTDEELQQVWESKTDTHMYGLMNDKKEKLGTDREFKTVGLKKFPTDSPPAVACQKGSKGADDPSPNQDNFSITYFKNGYAMACTFDGHGKDGHRVATRTVQTVPYFLAKSELFPEKMEEALTEAFLNAQEELASYAIENKWDAEASGSTAVAAVWKDNTVWLANAGDSRAVVVSRAVGSKGKILAETRDHKPEDEDEKARIEEMGGEVRSKTFDDGWVSHRIFKKDERWPGLCMSRTLGDNCAKDVGVIAEPDVTCHKLDADSSPFIVLASDGVWEFMDSAQVAKNMAKSLERQAPLKVAQKINQEARRRWAKNEEDYCDDITTVLIPL